MSQNRFKQLVVPDHEEHQQKLIKVSRRGNPVEKVDIKVPLMSIEEIVKDTPIHHTSNHREGPKEKGVSDIPHPLDRRSGTGRGKELRKQGASRYNWGTYKDDLKYDEILYISENEEKKKDKYVLQVSDIMPQRMRQRHKKNGKFRSQPQSTKSQIQPQPTGFTFKDEDFPKLE